MEEVCTVLSSKQQLEIGASLTKTTLDAEIESIIIPVISISKSFLSLTKRASLRGNADASSSTRAFSNDH